MRAVDLNRESILPIIDSSRSSFAMWINSTKDELPTSIKAFPKTDAIFSIRVCYPEEPAKTKMLNIDENTAAFVCLDGKIYGFDMLAINFHSSIMVVLEWLRNYRLQLNCEDAKVNCKAVSHCLMENIGSLFVPPQ